MARRLNHLLLVTLEDPANPRAWSGIPHSLLSALVARVPRVTVLGGQQLRPRRTPLHAALRFGLGGTPPRWPLWMTEPSMRHYAQVIEQCLAKSAAGPHGLPDAILSISSACLGCLHTPVPTYMFHDAPWLAFHQAYAPWQKTPWPGNAFARAEARAARRTRRIFTGSDWAVRESMRLYKLPRERFAEAHLGANWTPRQSTEELVVLAKARARSLARNAPLQLLFLGKDWERKGGPLALEIAAELHGQGQPVRLHIVGSSPRVSVQERAFITVHGVLDLGKPESREQLEQLFLASHFLLVPTQAECFGIVFAEAQGFAVPPVSRNVHALPSIVVNGKTGLLLPRAAPASTYAAALRKFVTAPEQYVAMAASARGYFESELTWKHAADVIASGIEATL